MSASNYVHIHVEEILRETEKALLVRLDDDREEWLPLSMLADPDDYAVGDKDVSIAVTEWLAREKDLETEE